MGFGPENDCAGESQQQITDPSSHQRGYVIRIMITRVQLKKKWLVMSLKGLGAKTNWIKQLCL
jgi:hypothetical protein